MTPQWHRHALISGMAWSRFPFVPVDNPDLAEKKNKKPKRKTKESAFNMHFAVPLLQILTRVLQSKQ